jgi:hypothetical protein
MRNDTYDGMILTNDFMTDAESFHLHSKRFKNYVECGLPKCDENLIPILNKISKINGLAPIFSCEGHADNPAWDSFYIMFAFDDVGMAKLGRIKSRLVQLGIEHHATEGVGKTYPVQNIGLNFTNRLHGITMKWYQVVNLNFGGRNYHQYKSLWLSDLEKVLDELIEG